MTSSERELLLLDVLGSLGRWASVELIGTVARNRGLRMAPGGVRAVLDRLADRGRCERRRGAGTAASYRLLPGDQARAVEK